MRAVDLYNIIDTDFKVDQIGAEEWNIDSVKEHVSKSFLKRNEGIMYDNAQEIQKVYTMTFPETNKIDQIINNGEQNVLIFSHHAQSWISEERNGEPLITMENLSLETLKKMNEQNISLYSIHIPLDNYNDISTGKCFAEALNMQIEKGCCLYLKALTGVIGKVQEKNVTDFQKRIENVIGHKSKIYAYGSDEIQNSNVGIVTGWGLDLEVLEEMHEAGINTFLTGFTRKLPLNKNIMSAHQFADKNKINLIGATHYSSEKFACIAMVEYFKRLGIKSEFIEGNYSVYDL